MLISLTASSQPKAFVVVPDSMTCLSPSEMNFFLEKYSESKEYKVSFNIKSEENSILAKENKSLRNAVSDKDKQIDTRSLQLSNCKGDRKFLEDQLSDANRKKHMLKVGMFTVGIVAVLELGYIGIVSILR